MNRSESYLHPANCSRKSGSLDLAVFPGLWMDHRDFQTGIIDLNPFAALVGVAY